MSLPALITLSGEWDDYLSDIYAQYLTDIVQQPKRLNGKPVRARYNPATHDKGFSFWHVISEGEREEDREPDLRRCERIAWIGWVLVEADQNNPRIKSWTNTRTSKRGTVTRLLLWVEDADYVVVLEERETYFLLVSAYPVSERRALKFQAEWEESQK